MPNYLARTSQAPADFFPRKFRLKHRACTTENWVRNLARHSIKFIWSFAKISCARKMVRDRWPLNNDQIEDKRHENKTKKLHNIHFSTSRSCFISVSLSNFFRRSADWRQCHENIYFNFKFLKRLLFDFCYEGKQRFIDKLIKRLLKIV